MKEIAWGIIEWLDYGEFSPALRTTVLSEVLKRHVTLDDAGNGEESATLALILQRGVKRVTA